MKTSRQLKTRRILDDSSDEENNTLSQEQSSSKLTKKEKNSEEDNGQVNNDCMMNRDYKSAEEKERLLEVTSPFSEPTMIPKRKTG